MIHRHNERERGVEGGQNGGEVNLGEVVEEQVGGCGPAINDDEIRFLQTVKNAVEFPAIGEVEKLRVGMKPFERRVFVVAVDGDVRDTLVLQELHEVNGKETFADAAFAVDDEIKTFHVFCGVSIRTWAIRGPRVRAGGVSLSEVFACASSREPASAGCGAAVGNLLSVDWR